MSPEELTREQMEEQLMSGQFEEPEAEVGEVPEEVAPEEEVPAPSLEDLQSRISQLEEETRNKGAALSEERDRRKISEGQYAQLMEYIQEAKNRAAQQEQEKYQEQYSEYDDYLKAVESRFGPTIRQMAERQAQLEQYLAQQYNQQQQMGSFQQQVQSYVQTKPDYSQAMTFLTERLRAKNGLFIQDPQQRDAVTANQLQQLAMTSNPAQLYELAKMEGYAPQETQGKPVDNPRQTVRPKSMATVPGASGNLPESWETKANKVINASLKDLEKIPLEELDAILKNMR